MRLRGFDAYQREFKARGISGESWNADPAEHLPILVTGDERHFRDIEPGLKEAARRIMAQIMEVQVLDRIVQPNDAAELARARRLLRTRKKVAQCDKGATSSSAGDSPELTTTRITGSTRSACNEKQVLRLLGRREGRRGEATLLQRGIWVGL